MKYSDKLGIHPEGIGVSLEVIMKLFTLDSRLILKKIGGLSAKDQKDVKTSLQALMGL